MKKNPSFGLCELTDLVTNKKILLPTVQRGFVWTPSQIENLWDSLLRGYPVGAIVLAPQKDGVWSLLDGQQRLTAICLGLGRATFRGEDAFQGTNMQIKIFIDLIPPDDEQDSRKFIFRAITRSHPWGYQRKDNTKTLDQSSIRKALDLYDNIKDPMAEKDLSKFFPYGAELPVPFEYFLGASTPQEILTRIKSTQTLQKVLERWMNTSSTPAETGERSDAKLLERIADIFARTSAIFEPGGMMEQRIPVLYLDLDLFPSDVEPLPILPSPQLGVDEDEEGALDEIENLFVRLNAGGTPLRGEELNYSILKSQVDSSLQDKIESCCGYFYNPARFITIAYRLFQAKPDRAGPESSISMRIKPKQFQRVMAHQKERTEFLNFLRSLLDPLEDERETLLGYAMKVLTYNPERVPFGLPYPVAVRLSDEAPEIVFLLLYRIWFKKDRFAPLQGEELHRKMLGVVSLLTWYGKDTRKGYRNLLNNVWPAAKALPKESFWSSAAIRRGQIDGILPPIPEMKSFIELTSFTGLAPSKWQKQFQKLMQDPFISNTFYNRSMVLFAQRAFLKKWFPDEQFHLSDTDAPFDWDHISPRRFIDKKRGIPQHVKDCYNMIGNLRAWPYSLNREDQDEAPAKKLNPLNRDHFGGNREALDDAAIRWKIYLNAKDSWLSDSRVSIDLLKWSFCDRDWLACDIENLKLARDWKQVSQLIIRRNLALCGHWYKQLSIDKLRPSKVDFRLEEGLDLRQWKRCPAAWEDAFNVEDFSYWIQEIKSLKSKDIDGYLYIGSPLTNDGDLGFLRHNAIEFGIYERNTGGFIGKLEIPENLTASYVNYGDQYLQGVFTLVSDDAESCRSLFGEFWLWLNKLPKTKKFANEIEGIAGEFKGGLKTKYM